MGFTLIESVAALGCLIVLTLLLFNAWRADWSTIDDVKTGRMPASGEKTEVQVDRLPLTPLVDENEQKDDELE